MKKILFGSAAAILAVVGLSAFKTANKATTTWYFTVNSSAVPQIAADNATVGLKKIPLTDLVSTQGVDVNPETCNSTGTDICVVTFPGADISGSGVISAAAVNSLTYTLRN